MLTRNVALAASAAVLALCCLVRPAACDPGQGVYFPGQAIANPDGALSLSVNPAGLAEPKSADLRLQADTRRSVDSIHGLDWGGFLSVPLGPVALAGAIEHATTPGLAQAWFGRSQGSLGMALALGDRAYIGGVTRWHASPGRNVRSWTLGWLTRPWTWLSLAGRVTGQHDDPGGINPRPLGRWALGLALRPTGNDRLTATLDMDWPEGRLGLPTWTASLGGRVVTGLNALVEFRDAEFAQGLHDQRISLLFRVGFGQAGVDVGAHSSKVTGGPDFSTPGMTAGLRISGESQPSLTDEGPAAVRVNLDGELSERNNGSGVHFTTLLQKLRRIERTSGVRLVVFQVQSLSADWAQVEELRTAIASLRASGKKVVWFSEDLGTRNLALAAACDRIVVPPAGTISARGIGGDFVGLADALGRVGIAVQAVKFGANKTAPEALVSDHPSEALTAQIQHSIHRQWQTFLQDVAMGRDVSPSAIEAALDRGAVFPEDAKAAGLIDAVVQVHDLEDRLRSWNFLGEHERVTAWKPAPRRRLVWGQQPRVAVVEIDGTITDHGGLSPTGGSLSGVELASVIRNAGRASSTRAVVARIRSPGGSVYGSDAMNHALRQASERKPVVASMGGVAASGGYWTALGTPFVFADRATVTGSIGIFVIKPSLAGLYDKLGIHLQHFGVGPHDAATSLSRPWSPAEQAAVQHNLARFYGLFLDRTAQGRKLDKALLPDLAEGRIWYGDEALQHRLIDRVGGIQAALDHVEREAKLDHDADEVRIDYLPRPSMLDRLKVSLGISAEATAQEQLWLRALQAAAGPWLDARALLQMTEARGPMALLPAHAAVPGP